MKAGTSHPFSRRDNLGDNRRKFTRLLPVTLIAALTLILVSSCTVSPTHPTLKEAELPPLVPVRAFTANIDYAGGYRVSPNGEKLLWRGVSRLRPALYWKNLATGKQGVKRFKKRTPRAFWAADSNHILYLTDPSGRENHRVYALNTRTGESHALTPANGTKAWVEHVPRNPSGDIYVAHNARDPEWFDLYRHNLDTGESTLIDENLDAVVRRLLDDDGREILRQRLEDDHFIAEVREGESYREVLRHNRFTDWYPFEITPDSTTAYALSNRDRDRLALVTTNLNDGSEKVLYEHPRVDIGNVWMDPTTRTPMYYQTYDGYPADVVLDESLDELLKPLRSDEPFGININSLSRDRSTGTVTRYDHTGATYYLIEGGGNTLTELGQSPSRKRAEAWTQVEPFSIPARDGLQLHGYLTRPKTNLSKPVPTVLYVHGGPWARDYWGHDDYAQMLANRGYAVLRVNY
jgi:dipeptidyl aminopeptidase/acylaminoacyl peptidase